MGPEGRFRDGLLSFLSLLLIESKLTKEYDLNQNIDEFARKTSCELFCTILDIIFKQ